MVISMNADTNQVRCRPTPYASVTAAVILLALSGVAYRAAAQRFGRSGEGVVLPSGTLARIPLTIDDWHGKDVPLDEAVVKATDTDQLINRFYNQSTSAKSVAFYVCFGIQLRDLAPHRPEVCYPSAGWTLQKTKVVEVPLPDGSTIPCQVHSFRRGGLQSNRVTVLNYYIVDGEYCPDVSLLRSKQWQSESRGATYAAQVQITVSGDSPVGTPEQTVREFASVSGSPLRDLLLEAVEQAAASGEGP